jgi:hypothetical protein
VAGDIEKARTLETGDNDRHKNMRMFARGAMMLLLECLPQ